MTLTDFLLARIAEDEARWAGGHDYWCSWSQASDPCDCPRKRGLAECETKQGIVAEHEPYPMAGGTEVYCSTCGDVPQVDYPCRTLRLLALPYADHPDHEEAWKP